MGRYNAISNHIQSSQSSGQKRKSARLNANLIDPRHSKSNDRKHKVKKSAEKKPK